VTNTISTRLKSISLNFLEFKDAKNIVSHRDAENCKPEIGRHENSRPNLIFWQYKSVRDDNRNAH